MRFLLPLVLLAAACAPAQAQLDLAAIVERTAPPALPREFRGVWVATVSNIDWPSRPGLPAEQQKAELIRILDTVRRMRLNAVVFQVRPAADALYASAIEPWSPYLTGEMGKAPEPFYDPLQFAIEEAHKRGLELHAWFNPFRAQHPNNKSLSDQHISRTNPELVRAYGQYLWLDPGDPAARAHSLRVFADVVRRYDVDGIHIDDYFYPYQERDSARNLIPFPDSQSYAVYRAQGGRLERDDWRRDNIDTFVREMYTVIKQIKPAVKVGISPFGIWRPGHPKTVFGMDAFATIYADARKWLREGWVDYFVPQLYWRTAAPQQPYVDLLRWWAEQNEKERLVLAGNAPYRVLSGGDSQQWPVAEITEQIRLTRAEPGAHGNVHFNMSSFLRNRGGLVDSLIANTYNYDVLMPRTSWIDQQPPPAPMLRIEPHTLLRATLAIEPAPGEAPFQFAVRLRFGEKWYAEVIPASQRQYLLLRGDPPVLPDEIAVTAVDRHGNESSFAIARPR